MFKVYLNVLKHASFVYSVCGPSAFYSGPSFPTLFFLVLTQCDGCLDDTVGAYGWLVGIATHGSRSLSRGPQVTVEVPCYPRYPSSIRCDATLSSN